MVSRFCVLYAPCTLTFRDASVNHPPPFAGGYCCIYLHNVSNATEFIILVLSLAKFSTTGRSSISVSALLQAHIARSGSDSVFSCVVCGPPISVHPQSSQETLPFPSMANGEGCVRYTNRHHKLHAPLLEPSSPGFNILLPRKYKSCFMKIVFFSSTGDPTSIKRPLGDNAISGAVLSSAGMFGFVSSVVRRQAFSKISSLNDSLEALFSR